MPREFVVRDAESEWQDTADGVWHKVLSVDERTGGFSMMTRMAPGAVFPSHRHQGAIHYYVVYGEVEVQGQPARTGDFGFEQAGAIHDSTITPIETVCFNHYFGALELLDEKGEVVSVIDWKWAKDQAEKAGRLPSVTVEPPPVATNAG
ncbi:cupin domain-containing protein [Amycolatopsis pithecellobii]|uniref:Cupin domain-containing protein n=1 Tax=Amycolatopsis pithecellobii TaxID=664692 RepID=A0A6N7Z5Q4_9PSEU|nr:cupin domain-containing protein [Amycolatopsis pithecellobii]MTD56071.1 cupin domain-containing protein [Amycolatopsis pithecellobii]